MAHAEDLFLPQGDQLVARLLNDRFSSQSFALLTVTDRIAALRAFTVDL
jgi:hypothetical protein